MHPPSQKSPWIHTNRRSPQGSFDRFPATVTRMPKTSLGYRDIVHSLLQLHIRVRDQATAVSPEPSRECATLKTLEALNGS